MNTINENFKLVVNQLLEEGNKITQIAKAMGYTTTTQLYNPMEGKSIITSNALEKFVVKFNVNPNYLFFGKGKMFNVIDSNNIGFVIYNPENKVYLGESDCFVSKLKSARIYHENIHAESVMFNFPSQYPDNPYGKVLVIKRILMEELED